MVACLLAQFFTPASKSVNMGIKHLLCFQQEKRLQ